MNLEIALRMCEAALKQAAREGAGVSVAVVDSGGHLVAFQRMEGAEIAGPVLAPGKAYTAVANRITTAELAALAAPGGELFGLAGDRFICFGGGIPLWADYGEENAWSAAWASAAARSRRTWPSPKRPPRSGEGAERTLSATRTAGIRHD